MATRAVADAYNRTLGGLRDVGRAVAEAHHVPFADVHEAMGKVLRCCPFHEELNRYVLRVRGLPNRPVRGTWGGRALVFAREQLEAGEFSS